MTFQILSLSGGGYLGLYTACVLADLEERSGRRVIDMFDLVAGTSIGGIIALGLSAGRSAAEIRDAFLAQGPSIFGSSRRGGTMQTVWKLARSALKPGYSAVPLRATIERIIDSSTCMRDLLRPTIVTAVNLTKGGPKVFKTGHHPRLVLDWRLPVVEVALATSAAPTYFPVHRIGTELFADGGMFANSPDLVALHEAEHFLVVDRADVRLLSVGTTTTCFAMSNAINRRMGSLNWLWRERLTNVMIGSQQAVTDDMMRHILADRYVRVDRAQADDQRKELALDCASSVAQADLRAMAGLSVAEASKNQMLAEMLRHQAAHRPFLNASM